MAYQDPESLARNSMIHEPSATMLTSLIRSLRSASSDSLNCWKHVLVSVESINICYHCQHILDCSYGILCILLSRHLGFSGKLITSCPLISDHTKFSVSTFLCSYSIRGVWCLWRSLRFFVYRDTFYRAQSCLLQQNPATYGRCAQSDPTNSAVLEWPIKYCSVVLWSRSLMCSMMLYERVMQRELAERVKNCGLSLVDTSR